MKRYTVDSNRVKATIKNLIKKGNVTHLRITNESGRELVNVPVTVAGLALFAAPFWMTLGVAIAFARKCHIDVVTND